jgi:hypothetical protein
MRTSILHREAAVLIAVVSCAGLVAAQTSPTHRVPVHRARPSAAHPPAVAPVEPPPPPNWPVNDQPTPAAVEWDNNAGLRINAANSSLQQILGSLSTITGTKVEGFGKDQRVFGSYGPGEPRDVLTQLLHGSGYNFLMIGDQGRGGAPQQILLSARNGNGGGVSQPPAHSAQEDSDDESYDNQIDTQPPQPPQQQQPLPPGRPGFGPEGPARTPQQIQQELMQRQQQILQQQQIQQGTPVQPNPQN